MQNLHLSSEKSKPQPSQLPINISKRITLDIKPTPSPGVTFLPPDTYPTHRLYRRQLSFQAPTPFSEQPLTSESANPHISMLSQMVRTPHTYRFIAGFPFVLEKYL